ncbi:MAG: DEAD/DEAH box helicase [Phycisphaerae bacterium]|nr:DEAD/DEAH box helicase [Phycisphaerae bacterium]
MLLADSFAALGLTPTLLRALADEGYTTPTPIQAKAIPTVLSGKDVLGCAQTGTGKTAAFALPILQRLTADHHATTPGRAPRALVLSPTRELATQIGDSFATYGRHTGIRHTVIFGGVGQNPQVQALHRGVDVLVATPGRLIDLLEQRLVNLSAVRILILDEADRMLDMGFIQPIRRIVASLPKNHPRQTLLFSATMPKEIMHLADSLLKDPVKVAVTPVASAAPLIEQKLFHVSRADKPALLGHIIEASAVARAVVFTKTKHGADKLCRKLHAAGIASVAIHGNKAQNQRTRALDAFKAGRVRVLVATDVAARGLDVDGITHVFNFDMPMEPEAYVHRIGRTGRAGASGLAISFCDQDERDLLRQVERLTAKRIPTAPLPAPLPPLPAKHAPLDQTHPTFDHPVSHGGRGHRGHAPRGNSRGNTRRDDPAGHGHRAHSAGHGSAHGDAPRSGGSRPPGAPKPGWMHASRGGPRRGR